MLGTTSPKDAVSQPWTRAHVSLTSLVPDSSHTHSDLGKTLLYYNKLTDFSANVARSRELKIFIGCFISNLYLKLRTNFWFIKIRKNIILSVLMGINSFKI